MLSSLKLWNFNSGGLHNEELGPSAFVLRTCQRTLVLSFDSLHLKKDSSVQFEIHEGQGAYLFLLETICGLKSKLIGENEIVGQFKEAYKIYIESTIKDTRLLLVLEKLFKDAKDIRTKYLIGISQKTYASLTRKHFITRARAGHIVILGSGQLAEDLINQFKKKTNVSICARNSDKVKELSQTHQIGIIPWEERYNLVNTPYIANTIGCSSVIFEEAFFNDWATLNPERLFVDLGSPSAIKTPFSMQERVVRLEDIFNEGAVVEEQKQQQINLTREAMYSVALKRKALFEEKFDRKFKLVSPQIIRDVRYL